MFRGGGFLKRLLSIVAAVAMVGTVAGVGVAAYADGDSQPTTSGDTSTTQTQTTETPTTDGAAGSKTSESGESKTDTKSDSAGANADTAQSGDAAASANADASAAVPSVRDVAPAASTGSLLVDETFKNSTFSDPSKWSTKDGACLTARGCSSTTDTNDIQRRGAGTGYLQLTDGSTGTRGSVLYNQAIPSGNGLDITFDYYMYGGKAYDGTYGDGISFFLTDGAATLSQTGAGGAGMGYASVDEDGAGSSARSEGIAQGVLGIGLDEFGNFSKQSIYSSGSTDRVTGGNDCTQGYDGGSHTVTLRGKGTQDDNGKWNNGYCVVAGAHQNDSFRTGTATASEDDSNGKTVRVLISEPNADGFQTVTVYIDGTQVVSHTLDYKLPTSIKFGFSAGTGAASQAQLIRGLSAHSVKSLTAIDLVKAVNKDTYPDADTHIFKSGDKVPYVFTVTNGGTTTLNNVTVTDPNISNISCPETTLAPGSPMTCTGELTLTDDLVKDGKFTNTATATGTDGTKDVSDTDSVTINTVRPLGAPDHHKRIKSNGDGSYTLNLDVTGDSTEQDTTKVQPLDIALVLDVSGSMDENIASGRDQPKKIDALKTAVNNFINATADENAKISDTNQKNRIALVKFAGDEKTSVGDDFYDEGWYSYNNTQIVSNLTSDLSGLSTNVNNLNAAGATHADYGLQKAQVALQKARPNAKKVVIFFTDGEPTSGSSFETSVANAAIKNSKALKDSGATVYSIGVFAAADPSNTSTSRNNRFNAYMHGVSSNYPNATAWNNLGQRADNSDYYKAATNADELNKIFNQIQHDVSGTSYSNVSITDELSKYVRLSKSVKYESTAAADGFHKVNGGVTVKVKDGASETATDFDNNSYTVWYKPAAEGSADSTGTIQVRFADGYKLEKGSTYTLSFDVDLTQTAYDEYASNGSGYGDDMDSTTGAPDTDIDAGNPTSSGQRGFHSNNHAYVTYTADGQKKTTDYTHPVVQAQSGSLTVTKQWKPAAPEGAEVTVLLVQDGKDTNRTVTLDANNHWTGSFGNLAPGHKYTVKENPEVQGFTPTVVYSKNDTAITGDKPAVNLTASDVWANPQTSYKAVITNTRNTVDLPKGEIEVGKVLAGREWKSTDSFSFTIKAADGSQEPTPLPDPATVTVDDKSTGAATADSPKTAGFDKITYSAAGAYKYTVTESQTNKVAGLHYSGAEYEVIVTVEAKDGVLQTPTVSVRQVKDDNGKDVAGAKPGSGPATFTNTYIAVSSLPLTGGKSARDWLIYGGGLGLLALLAGAGYTVWRKRQLV